MSSQVFWTAMHIAPPGKTAIICRVGCRRPESHWEGLPVANYAFHAASSHGTGRPLRDTRRCCGSSRMPTRDPPAITTLRWSGSMPWRLGADYRLGAPGHDTYRPEKNGPKYSYCEMERAEVKDQTTDRRTSSAKVREDRPPSIGGLQVRAGPDGFQGPVRNLVSASRDS